MSRLVALSALSLLLVALPATAQQPEAAPVQVYVAHYKISIADLETWNRNYHEHSVPVLQALQDERVIEGWGAWQHSTAGEYNWRLAIRAASWPQLGEFWEQYLERLRAGNPEAFRRGSEMIQAHYDEIWDLTTVRVPDPQPAIQYMYDSRFQLRFSDMDEWNGTWNRVAAPILDQAMADGLLVGWVVEQHNTGGRYNWKVLYLFDEWDDMDDLFERLRSGLMADEPLWQRTTRLIIAHDDVIWAAVPDPGM